MSLIQLVVDASSLTEAKMKTPVIFVVLVILNLSWSEVTDGTFLDKFRYGIELVRRLLDTDKGYFGRFFTRFESREYNIFPKRSRDDFTKSLLEAIMKSIAGSREEMTQTGIKISVLVAKIISDAYSQTGRVSRGAVIQEFSPMNTLFRQTQVKDLITTVKDPNLMEKVTKEFSKEGNECLQLLFCKLSPFVKGMQMSLSFFAGAVNGDKSMDENQKAWAKSTPIERMYLFMPGINEFVENCDICDDRYPSCRY